MKQLTEQEAIRLFKTQWWTYKTDYEIALFQLRQERLCIHFSIFHGSLENALKRPVWIHEFARKDLLLKELIKKKDLPSME